ncbi:mel-26, partial [Pristionchus pacificus]
MGHSSQTEIKVERVKHEWTVKNFSHCYQEYLENFVHLPRGEETLTWSIKIYPKGNGENNKDFVFLCLNRVVAPVQGKLSKIGFKSRFSLKSAENKEIDMRIHPNPSHSDYVSYIKRDVLFPQILPRDSITVAVEIDVATETVTTTSDPLPIMTDFTIRVGDKEIRTHRAVLAARSPVFCAMLTHEDTNESKSGVMHITDMDHDVVQEMLTYVYSGRCSKDIGEMAGDLLIAADKYRLDELKQHCECSLIEQISVDNVCQLLVLSDMYRAHKLREYSLIFITHRTKMVTCTPGWSDILKSHPNLVTDIVNGFDK